MPRLARTLTLTMILALPFLAGTATTASAQDVFEACEADIATYCDAVEPGNGRVVACLYAHEDKVSEACDEATESIGDLLDHFFDRVSEVGRQCGADIETHCADVAVGGGRVLSCLSEKRDQVSSACQSVLSSMASSSE